ncbi:hypothetical protein R3751_15980 [Halorubrum distributum]|uniref:hypothetical protein n=1 Tax=Halorubrum distributum TaxID=29283 RepID=UPI0029552BBE|nr:hypothetical protein [Halorubrum distributum]MDV7351264.1 hypothetical protein [Halorubrum distributum]
MERKALAALCLLALVALAGCSATGSLSMETADDAELAEAASRPAVVDSPAPDDREVVREAIEDGSETATATDPPVKRGLPLAYEGSYYEIDWNVTGTESGPRSPSASISTGRRQPTRQSASRNSPSLTAGCWVIYSRA